MAVPSQYIRVDSALGANEKMLGVPDDLYLEVVGLFVLMLGRCDIANTDGVLTVRAITGMRGIAPGRHDLLDALVDADLVERDGGTVTIPDYLDWQRSADEKLSASERARMAARAKHSNTDAHRHAETDAYTDAETDAYTDAEHLEHLEHLEQAQRAERETRARADFDALWEAYPVHTYKVASERAFAAFDGNVDDLIAAARAVPRTYEQTLRYFIIDGTWRDYVPKRKRPKCATCSGAGVVIDGDVARPCPECAS